VSDAPPDFSVVARERLVAHVWKRDGGGKLRRAGNAPNPDLADLPWAEVHVFDPARAKLLAELAAKSADLDAWFFELGMEGLDVKPGAVKPNFGSRSF
jgi:hypothetical protein